MGWDYICNCLLDEWETDFLSPATRQWSLFP